MHSDPYKGFTLLIDGKEAFPVILREIDTAEKSIRINMFIWRDDEIGNRMAAAVLAAAERGVRVDISVDRYGVVLEKAEESKRSFFHKTQTFPEKCKIWGLGLLYPMRGTPKRQKDTVSPLYERILAHPNIRVSADVFKADHSKFYIFDGKTLILGGVNIEDKENGADMQGRVYGDYMVKLTGEEQVAAFLAALGGEAPRVDAPYFFGMNTKSTIPYRFDMEGLYLSMIEEAERELHITMAYFSPLKKFTRAILAAHRRGVKVSVMIPAHANFQDSANRKTVRYLLKKSGGGIAVYLSPRMLHTKLIATEKTVSFGSTNITKKAFCQLSELNLFLQNNGGALPVAILQNEKERMAEATRVSDYRKIRYNAPLAFLEGFVV